MPEQVWDYYYVLPNCLHVRGNGATFHVLDVCATLQYSIAR